MADITAILTTSQSHDLAARQAAETQLRVAEESNLAGFLTGLASELGNDQKPPETRQLAGLILKNAVTSKDEARKAELQQRWLSIDGGTRNVIKQHVWGALGSELKEIRHTGAQAVSKIAGAEIPHKQWPDLVSGLQANVADTNARPGLRQATLEALGFICEEVTPEHLTDTEVNAMLTAIFSGMRKEEPDVEVRLAACVALSNAMFFASENFERQNERDHIMQVTCECTVCPDVRVRQAAYEVLVGVAENYYDKLAPYITAIFNLTTKATKEDDESVALQAIEFWSAVCEEEVAIQDEIEDGVDEPPVYHRFVEQALGQVRVGAFPNHSLHVCRLSRVITYTHHERLTLSFLSLSSCRCCLKPSPSRTRTKSRTGTTRGTWRWLVVRVLVWSRRASGTKSWTRRCHSSRRTSGTKSCGV
jgi:importin subunit beta-1